jgi:hypothetical protein
MLIPGFFMVSLSPGYTDCQKYVPIDLASPLNVIASEAKQSDVTHRPEQSRGIP